MLAGADSGLLVVGRKVGTAVNVGGKVLMIVGESDPSTGISSLLVGTIARVGVIVGDSKISSWPLAESTEMERVVVSISISRNLVSSTIHSPFVSGR